MELKDRIKIARKAAGYKSQEKLAECLGTTRPAIASYELGNVVPNDVFLQLMATKLGISYEWLKNGEGEMRQPPAGLDAILSGLDADDVEIVQIYAELPPEHRRILKDFVRKVADAATARQQTVPAATEPLPQERPHWMTEEEWGDLQRGRTAQAGGSTEAG